MSQCVHGILGIALGCWAPRAESSAKREVERALLKWPGCINGRAWWGFTSWTHFHCRVFEHPHKNSPETCLSLDGSWQRALGLAPACLRWFMIQVTLQCSGKSMVFITNGGGSVR